MSKYVQQGVGNYSNPPITQYPVSGSQVGFRVRVDLNDPKTPSDLTDDTWIIFYLDGNQLKMVKSGSTEVLSSRICTGFVADHMPQFPASGFYVYITDQGVAVDVGLMGRYSPSSSVGPDNPQVSMKTRLVALSSSAQ